MTVPRSFRNHNPGNIRIGSPWQGLIPRDLMTTEQRAETEFCVFKAPEWGFRAMTILLRNYFDIYHKDTVRLIVKKWAPPSENDTSAYVNDVAARLSVGPDEQIDPRRREIAQPLIKAITIHETGSWEPWWRDEDLSKGLDLARV